MIPVIKNFNKNNNNRTKATICVICFRQLKRSCPPSIFFINFSINFHLWEQNTGWEITVEFISDSGKIVCCSMLYMFVIPRMSSLDAVIDEHEALDFTRACENANFRSDQKQVRRGFPHMCCKKYVRR